MPITYATVPASDVPAVYVIHENADWTGPLFTALNGLGVAYHDWNLAKVSLDLSESAPLGVFYNRMSASSHTRGNRFAPEMTAGVLAWLEGQGRRVINGRQALHLEISKMIQYAALRHAGMNVPQTVAATSAEGIICAFFSFKGQSIITKHNRAGKGLGVALFHSSSSLTDYVNSDVFNAPVDGITLVQRYISSPEQLITRVEFVGREFVYAVRVDTSKGFELCPADACSLGATTCMVDAEPRFAFDIDSDFAASALGQSLIPKMQSVMISEGLDVAAFEFIVDEDGKAYVYDINTNTNYNSNAEQRAGISAMAVLAAYLASTLREEEVRVAA